MKVFMINSVCGVGSTGKICTETADILLSEGHDCKIAYGRGAVPEKCEKYAVKVGNKAGVYTHALLSRVFDNAGFCSTGATKMLVKQIKEYGPDLIHLHNLHGYYINIKVLFEFLKEARIPVVWTLHDCWSFTGHCAHYVHKNCEKWKTQCGNCPSKKGYPSSVIADRSAKNFTEKKRLFTGVRNLTVTTPSEWLKSQAEQSFMRKHPIRVINNAIDTTAFKPTASDFREKNGLESKRILLGVANVWGKGKGVDELIRLSQTLGDEYKVVIVGQLRNQVLPDNILHIEHTDSREELAAIYTAADLFVNPTHAEVFGLVNTEALACGTPVVTFDAGGSPETIDETCGKVVKLGDFDGLGKAVREFTAPAENCRKRAEKFDKNDSFRKYIDLYKDILKKGCSK